MPVLIKVQRFWSEHHETLQVLLTGSLVTILAYTGKTLGAKLTRNREAETNVVHPFEIDMMTFMSISSSLNYIIFVIYSLSIPTNLFAIYSSVTNNTLSLSIRAIATSESVTRLAYTITIAFLIYCNLWPLSGSTIIIAFMITLDFFTWRKLKNHQKKDKLTQAEKRLMKQMICSSVIYAINYLGLIVLHTIFAPFLGRFLLSLALQIVNVVRGGLYTLGQR
ncbi:unnamed protein product, partial [Mesorhabditis belari]|uniref:Uncharacterized protein n=1 Tax=Mesorhabditis belari TaxID=2138241 RepID=A0AAF3FS79_9BILA